MLKPLRQFYCDECHELIENPSQGSLEWLEPEIGKPESFRIIHKPFAKKGCRQYAEHPDGGDIGLDEVLTRSEPAYLMRHKLDNRKHPHNQNISWKKTLDYVETYRRLKVPYYETARFNMRDALGDGFFVGMTEDQIFSAETMKMVVEKYCPDS